jgi:hypothetical protein
MGNVEKTIYLFTLTGLTNLWLSGFFSGTWRVGVGKNSWQDQLVRT